MDPTFPLFSCMKCGEELEENCECEEDIHDEEMNDAEEHGTSTELTSTMSIDSEEQECSIYLEAPELEQQVSYVASAGASASAMSVNDSEDWESVSQEMPTIRGGETVLKYGPHKGMTYQQVLQKHPEYL